MLLLLSDAGYVARECFYIVSARNLTPGDVAFLRRRLVDGRCAARNKVPCATPPCAGARQPSGADGAGVCVNNFCGACTAEWYDASGGPLRCRHGTGWWGGWFATPTPTPRRRYGR
eukprot:TRINITY_DN9055_c0_g1_i1.p5 TRINITY_DN9055_c0_g1~~TRINITY_DN9055_c0_g1_i1.p5  ORF type:complete len:116 (-),score=20.81 TRINITY_DN9055_c0_g1_i1:171-518(-)